MCAEDIHVDTCALQSGLDEHVSVMRFANSCLISHGGQRILSLSLVMTLFYQNNRKVS